MKEEMFHTNSAKAANKLTISSFMMGSIFMIFTIIWTLNPEKFSLILISELVLAIPLLYVSSLAYTKIVHLKELKLWDMLGWFTNNLANLFLLNVVGLMIAQIYSHLAYIYFGMVLMLMFIYSAVNVIYWPHTLKQKLFKFLFVVIVVVFGGILPIMGYY